MTPDQPSPNPALRVDPNALPPPKWWGRFVLEGNPPQRRFVVRWKAILTVAASVGLAAYLCLATLLWGYYAVYRHIPGVRWIDVAILPRFSHVEEAIGQSYYVDAKASLDHGDLLRAIFTARAAVQKAPANLEARVFLAECWRKAGRNVEAVRTLRDGVAYSGQDPRFEEYAVRTCLEAGRFQDLLKLVREDFPAHGVRLLDKKEWIYRLAEVRAVLETAGPAQASAVAASHPDLDSIPQAAPLLSQIDVELGRGPQALERLAAARKTSPTDATILAAYATAAKSANRVDDAREAARALLRAYPGSIDAQLCFLEMFGSRTGADKAPWTAECMIYLTQHRTQTGAMARLASLAAAQGWVDLTFLLYQNSLQENLTGLPFAIYYAAGLVKKGDVAGADSVWHELTQTNAAQLSAAAYVEAMIATGAGRDSEAQQIIQQLRHDTSDDPARRRSLALLFRDFGYPKIAEMMTVPDGA